MHNKNPLISIIVPVYNAIGTLRRCLNSIINQTYKNLEIIVVESASTDGSAALCDEYARLDSRIRTIHQKEKRGLSNARNEGLKLVSGEYIGFVDSDDWIALDGYEYLLSLLLENHADISCGEIVRVASEKYISQNNKIVQHVYTNNEYAKKFFKYGSKRTVHYIWNKLYTADVAKKIYFPEGSLAEDVEGFYFALSNAKKIVESNKLFYFYWYNPDGLSSEWFSKKQMDIITVWKTVYDDVKKTNPQWVKYAQTYYYRSFFGMLCRMLLSGKSKDFPEEKEYLLRQVKKYYFQLLLSPIPISRKAIMTSMCINYDLTEKVYFLKNGKKEKII